jgi:hypothetical protein
LINVRWAPSVDDTTRAHLESQYSLSDGEPQDRRSRTWSYALKDTSRANIRALISNSAVEDTQNLHRTAFRAGYFSPRGSYPTPNAWIPASLEVLRTLFLLVGLAGMTLSLLELATPAAVRGSMSGVRAAFLDPAAVLRRPMGSTRTAIDVATPGDVGKKHSVYPLALVAIVALGYAPITWVAIRQGDFPNHIRRAEALTQGVMAVPHILFHTVTAGGILAGLPPAVAATVVIVGFQVLAAWGVSWLARRWGATAGVAAGLGICLVCVAPILPLARAADADLYPFGYFVPNALHNPTVTAAKAFVPFLIELGVMVAGLASVVWSGSIIAIVVILAGLAKPHYVSCLVPVVVTAWAWRRWRGQPAPWNRVMIFTGAAVAIMLWAVFGTMSLAGGGNTIIAPLVVLRSWGGIDVPVDALAIVMRACSDLAFPIAVVMLWPGARRFPPVLLAWGAYAIALGQALLLAESGVRLHDGNFLWSPQLATFGVMAASAAWLGRSSHQWNGRVIAGWSVLLLHVAYGAWWINARLAAG